MLNLFIITRSCYSHYKKKYVYLFCDADEMRAQGLYDFHSTSVGMHDHRLQPLF